MWLKRLVTYTLIFFTVGLLVFFGVWVINL